MAHTDPDPCTRTSSQVTGQILLVHPTGRPDGAAPPPGPAALGPGRLIQPGGATIPLAADATAETIAVVARRGGARTIMIHPTAPNLLADTAVPVLVLNACRSAHRVSLYSPRDV